MRKIYLLFASLAVYAWIAVGCSPIEPDNYSVGETSTPPMATLALTALPPQVQAALDAANAHLQDKIANLRFTGIQNIGTDSVPRYRVDYQYVFQQIPIWAEGVTVFVEADGGVSSIESYNPYVSVTSVIPSITLERAAQVAARFIGVKGQQTLGPDAELIIYPAGLSGDIQNNYVLAWHFVLTADCPEGDWSAIVNATDSTMLFLLNLKESPKPLVGPCTTPPPLPSVTPGPPNVIKPLAATSAAYPPPATPTAGGYPTK